MRRRLVLLNAMCGVLFAAFAAGSVGVAGAQMQGPEEWDGHGYGQCEPVTHASYYDPRNDGTQGVLNQDHPNGDNVYYVDDDPLAGFQADGNYDDSNAPNHDCDGAPALRATAYVAVTIPGAMFVDDQHIGYPGCTTDPTKTRNPGCEPTTGVRGGAYVAEGDNSNGHGVRGGVTSPLP